METSFDLVVIGAGPGGYVAAIKAAQKGMQVAVVEQDKAGGTCLNRGCIPTKALIHATHLYREMAVAAELGITVQGLGYDMAKIHGRKAEVVTHLREGVEFLLKANKVVQICGRATIPAPGSVLVQGTEGETTLQAKHILVATGSVPAKPPVPGLDLPGILTSDDLLEGDACDLQSLAIIGGGVIGVEFASIYAALGCEVTVLEAAGRLLPGMDREISQNLAMILKKRGIAVHTGAAVQGVQQAEGGYTCQFETKRGPAEVTAQAVLVATGRRPCFDGLFTGEAPETNRGIVVDAQYRTSLPGVWAIGDVVDGGIQLAHMASAQGAAAVTCMAGESPEQDLAHVPACVYTDPEIACVGITADEAKTAGIPVQTGKFAMAALGKSVIESAERGFIKIVTHAETGRLLGAQLMCQRATDLVGELATAIVNGLTAQQLAAVIRPHPTFAEGVGEAVEDVFGTAVHIAPKRRLG